jgi:hypothetical protein
MTTRDQKREAKLKRRERLRLSKLNKKTMETRWKENKPRAYYPKLDSQESPMEIWIGDAVNLCTRCKENKIFTNTIVIVVDILSPEKVRVALTRNESFDTEVNKIRFDHRICSGTHLFKRIPKKPFKF